MNKHDFMKLAINLAKSTKGQTSPNPLVGAIVVKDGQIVGMGAHLKAGDAHAEVHAIKMAGNQAKGSTIYVTLEPCSHYGRTPPCAKLIIESGIKRVVIASTDPNPNVAGRGIEMLQNAGIMVEVGVLKEEAMQLNRIFFHYIKTNKPFVTIKTANSLDGKIATKLGESKWITSEAARQDVHQYRHEHDSILVGVNTVITDNPSLTTRLPDGGKNPIRIILDTKLRTPFESKIIMDNEAETWLIIGSEVPKEKQKKYTDKGVRVVPMKSNVIHIDEVLDTLGKMGITSIFVEGGATVNDSFLRSKLINQVVTYISAKLIGGSDAPTSFSGVGFERLSEIMELSFQSVEMIGPDIKIVAFPRGG